MPPSPILSPGSAILASLAVTVSYVGSLYLFSAHRIGGKNEARYTDDKLIVHRLKVASISTFCNVISCAALIASQFHKAGDSTPLSSSLSVLGLIPTSAPFGHGVLNGLKVALIQHYIPVLCLPLSLTAFLYIGPLYACALDGGLPFQRNFSLQADVVDRFTRLAGVRTYVVGPLTEELVFRSCILGLSVCANFSRKELIYLTPAYFSVAHCHHAWENYVRDGRTSEALKRATLTGVFQMAYTAIFGWYANFLFLRTGSMLAPFFCHVFCNVMSLPDLRGAEARHPRKRLSLRVAHLFGIISFFFMLGRLTQPQYFGGPSLWS